MLFRSCAVLVFGGSLAVVTPVAGGLAQAQETSAPSAELVPVDQAFRQTVTQAYADALRPDEKVELADRLLRGLPYSPTNPLHVRDVQLGMDLYEQALASASGEAKALLQLQYGKALLASAEEDKAPLAVRMLEDALQAGRTDAGLRLAAEFASKPENTGDSVDLERAQALVAPLLPDGDPQTLLTYADLIASTDAGQAGSLRLLALTQLAVLAETSPQAALVVGDAYAQGTFGERNVEKAVAEYARALAGGKDGAGTRILRLLQDQLDNPEIAAQVKNALITSVTLGSTKSALELLKDYTRQDQLGLTAPEAEQLVNLLIGINHTDGFFYQTRMFEKLIAQGTAPSVAEMDAAVDKLLATDAPISADEAEKIGRQILKSTLPAEQRFGYSLRFFEYAYDKGSVTAAYELGDLVLGRLSSSQYFSRQNNEELQMKALKALESAAARDYQLAMVRLGDVYRTNEFVELSLEKAEDWYKKAVAVEATPRALERLASFILATREDAPSLDDALSLLQSAAAQESASAMTTLGTIYLRGRRTMPADTARGLTWLRRAAESGSTQALIYLGDHKRDADEDMVAARELYEAAVAAGDGRAWVGIARLHELAGDKAAMLDALKTGADTGEPEVMVAYAFALMQETSPGEETFELLRKALVAGIDSSGTNLRVAETYISSGDLENIRTGMDILGVLVDRGYGPAISRTVEIHLSGVAGGPDIEKAMTVASAGLAQGYTAPLTHVSQVLSQGAPGIAADPARAISLLKQIYVKSPQSLDVAVRLGQAYSDGNYVERDLDLALQYFEEAATQGSVRAQIRTAKAYLDGIGTDRNAAKAITWYQQAADAGSTTALLQLGRIFASGGITEINPELAFVYFYRAAEADSTEAKAEVGRSLLAGFGIDQNVGLGVQWLEDAGSDGSSRAMYDLFFHYIYQDSPDARQIAINWLKRAAESGSAEAMFRYAAHLRAESRNDDAAGVKEWLTRASAAGHQYSASILAHGWKEYVE